MPARTMRLKSTALSPGGERFRVKAPGWREGVVLGIGLSLTNFVSGFGSGLLDHRMIWPTIMSITTAGYLAIRIGNVVTGDLPARWLGRFAPLVAGLIPIAVGLRELV
jgi:putative Mn2+ efflux pump MntP